MNDLDDNCNEQVSWGTISWDDNCSSTVTSNFVSGNVFNVGTTVVTYTNSDGSSYSNDAVCSFNVTVVDVTDPVISCPGNTSKNITSGECFYTISGTEFDATATDNCGTLVYAYILSGATTGTNYGSLDGVNLNLGTTTISWSADDGENIVMCSFDVEVVDNESPVAICPAPPTVELDGTGNGSLSVNALAGNSTDNCSIASETSPATAFDCDDIGTQQVMLTVEDDAGLTNSIMCDVEVEGSVKNNTQTTSYCSLQDAIDDANFGDVIQLTDDLAEGLVEVTEKVFINGDGYTITSTSPTYGISIQNVEVTIEDLNVETAGTFGIHQSPGMDDLLLDNVTVDNCGGTGIALNCSTNITLKDITSTNNGGNGVSITDCHNVTIENITTSGNEFSPGGFGAGVGIFFQ